MLLLNILLIIIVCFMTYWIYFLRKKLRLFNCSSHIDSFTQEFVDSIPAFISWIDDDLRYRRINKCLLNAIGGPVGDIIGQRLGYQGPSTEVFDFVKEFISSNKKSLDREISVIFDGSNESRDFLMTAIRLKNSKEIFLVSFDVTERNEYKRQVEIEKEKAYAQEKLALLGEMTAGIAHEISNPLTVINALAHKIVKIEKDDSKVSLGRKILSMTDRIVKITKGLKKISRNDGDSDFSECQLEEIIEDSLIISSYRIKNCGVKVEHFATPDCEITCNPVQISQIIINLINNALDAIDGISDKWIKVSAEDMGDLVQFRVVDCGKGIPTDIAKNIMKAFFTTKGVGKGTGLGLSLSVKIAKNHQGKFYLDEESENTCFVLEIPKIQELST